MGSGSSKKKLRKIETQKQSDGEIMQFFRKQSAECKKKLQHKLYIARETPEATFDISGCEVSEVPSGVFSLCKVLQKEALLLHNNWLSSLNNVGSFSDLSGLRVLDLHDNELTEIPEDIGVLTCLQVLNLSANKLKSLPDSIGKLNALQTLNVNDNRLNEIPDTLCSVQCLRTLDIKNNRINSIPKSLCKVRTLEHLILDAESMKYPPADVCVSGTEVIMTFLCSECGVDYIPPSKFLLDVLDAPIPSPVKDYNAVSFKIASDTIADTIQQYENVKEHRRQQRLALEKTLEEEQRKQAELAFQARTSQQRLISVVAKDQEKMHGELTNLQMKRDIERQNLLAALTQAENEATYLVQQMLEMNEQAKKTEALLEAMERERIEAEEWFTVRKEEEDSLRQKEVLIAMEMVLEESNMFEKIWQKYISERDAMAKEAFESADLVDNKLGEVFMNKQTEQNILIEKLMKEEELQKEAFEALQLQKDAKHHRITGQILLIEEELAQLTLLEVEQREMRLDTHVNLLKEKRQALTALLVQLMKEQAAREEELKKRLVEMEEQREAGQQNYWLIQYQRLMDRKPQSLIDQEHQLEYTVVHILEKAGASEYLPQFAAHRITIETLCQMTDSDLKQIGVREVGLRQAILIAISEYNELEITADKKAKALEYPHEEKAQAAASAPPVVHPPPSSPPPEVMARINSECVVCMNHDSDVVFLNCGHVCCCYQCAEPLTSCPLCRADIVQRVKLSRG